MPVGARQLGMGETAIALADDVFATFWNPAGLAFGPLADEWELSLKSNHTAQEKFTTLGSKEKKGFLSKEGLWSGTKEGLVHYNGKSWKKFHEHILEANENINSVVKDYIGTVVELDSFVKTVKEYNNIKSKEDESNLITLKLPYNLIFTKEEVTALLVDKTQRVWVGTNQGLYRFDGKRWKNLSKDPVFFSDSTQKDSTLYITSIALRGAEIWIGSKSGLYRYRKNEFIARGQNVLPTNHITAIATNEKSNEVFVALAQKGIAHYTPSRGQGLPAKWRIYSVSDGLLDSSVNNLVLDDYGHVWASHPIGVSHYNLNEWQRFNFNKQTVNNLELDENGNIWIGTNKGVWKHSPQYTSAKGRREKSNADESNFKKGEWIHYHSGNALVNNNDLVIESQGDDVWFVTDAGVERYNSAKSMVGLFYEQLLPALNIPDLFHAFMGGTFPLQEWGTVGGFINFISFGEITYTDELGETKEFPARELVGALSYGTKIGKKTSLGINLKFIYSALAPDLSPTQDQEDGRAVSYAVDVGFLWKKVLLNKVSFGLVMQNIGPAVFYVDRTQTDPLPFTWKLGVSYEVFNIPSNRLIIASDLNREAVYFEKDDPSPAPVYIGAWKDIIEPDDRGENSSYFGAMLDENIRKTVYNLGMEYTYANVVAFRSGLLYDIKGKRNELNLGGGLLVSDVLQADLSFIRDIGGGIRDGQWRASLVWKY